MGRGRWRKDDGLKSQTPNTAEEIRIREGWVEAGRWKSDIKNVREARMLEGKWERRVKSHIEHKVEMECDGSRGMRIDMAT